MRGESHVGFQQTELRDRVVKRGGHKVSSTWKHRKPFIAIFSSHTFLACCILHVHAAQCTYLAMTTRRGGGTGEVGNFTCLSSSREQGIHEAAEGGAGQDTEIRRPSEEHSLSRTYYFIQVGGMRRGLGVEGDCSIDRGGTGVGRGGQRREAR